MSFSLKSDKVENYAYWNQAFTPEECRTIIDIAKSQKLETAKVDLELSERVEIRDSNIVFLDTKDMPWVFERLGFIVNDLNSQYFNFDLWGFAEGLQFTEYNAPGGKYDSHIDKMYNGLIRKLTVVVQLTDPSEYDDGELHLLYRGERSPEIMSKEQGDLFAFPSYTLHKVTPVTRGTRHSLVGWITGKPFKYNRRYYDI